MKLWLVSFMVLFAIAEGLDYLGSLAWLKATDLSLPVAVVGGIGLAIASNASFAKGGSRASTPPASAIPPIPPTDGAIAEAEPPTRAAGRSISFEIKRRSRR